MAFGAPCQGRYDTRSTFWPKTKQLMGIVKRGTTQCRWNALRVQMATLFATVHNLNLGHRIIHHIFFHKKTVLG